MKTLLKIFILSFLLTPVFTATTLKPSEIKLHSQKYQENTHKERVCINGIWYIIVYGEDGSIINIYEDYE